MAVSYVLKGQLKKQRAALPVSKKWGGHSDELVPGKVISQPFLFTPPLLINKDAGPQEVAADWGDFCS